jgi:hypothetical protein
MIIRIKDFVLNLTGFGLISNPIPGKLSRFISFYCCTISHLPQIAFEERIMLRDSLTGSTKINSYMHFFKETKKELCFYVFDPMVPGASVFFTRFNILYKDSGLFIIENKFSEQDFRFVMIDKNWNLYEIWDAPFQERWCLAL